MSFDLETAVAYFISYGSGNNTQHIFLWLIGMHRQQTEPHYTSQVAKE